MDRNIFSDSSEDKLIYDSGFFIGKLLTSNQIDACRSLFNSLDAGMSSNFYNTLASPNKEYRRLVNTELDTITGNTVRNVFDKYKVLSHNFVVKAYGIVSECEFNNDDIHADENKYTCVNV